MLTTAAAHADALRGSAIDVQTVRQLEDGGCSRAACRANLEAGRWRRIGHAIVLHNGPLTREQRWRVGVANCGPGAVLASFSAAEAAGLRSWERDEVHTLTAIGVRRPRRTSVPVILHHTSRRIRPVLGGTCQPIEDALVLAGSSFAGPRPACGILAAGVQQRLTIPSRLRQALADAPRVRHRAAMLRAVADIEGGAQALSEIDFTRLCRRNGLPRPDQQSVRAERDGRRRYLDVEFVRPDGRRVVVEVDGAIHLAVERWCADQLRQNDVALSWSMVLRYPSVLVRTEEALVVAQLRRALS